MVSPSPHPTPADYAKATYMIGEPCARRTWRTENGRTLYLGEPLCAGCDRPVADGPCDCEIPASLTTPIVRERAA